VSHWTAKKEKGIAENLKSLDISSVSVTGAVAGCRYPVSAAGLAAATWFGRIT
jgi:hypothetical protein